MRVVVETDPPRIKVKNHPNPSRRPFLPRTTVAAVLIAANPTAATTTNNKNQNDEIVEIVVPLVVKNMMTTMIVSCPDHPVYDVHSR